jgi:hypothetical protein
MILPERVLGRFGALPDDGRLVTSGRAEARILHLGEWLEPINAAGML